jgi:hypothetical protein
MFTSRLTAAVCGFLITTLAHGECACQCIEGVPRTLCNSVAEAAENPALCGQNPPVCPPPVTPVDVERFEPPPGALDCRTARLLDPVTDAYTVSARVCDLADAESPQPPAR